MASAVDGVCRGGGVVASLMYGVEYDVNVEYGGSVEYDASLKLDVVCLEFDVLLLFAPKEQKVKKNTT